jgi:glycosyltransferase involved in cell wall biosynthesis
MMPRVLVNAAGSISGGGRTWLLGVVEEIERGGGGDVEWAFCVTADTAASLAEVVTSVGVVQVRSRSPLARVAFEQFILPQKRRRHGFDLLISAANFGPLLKAGGNVLLSRNALHFTPISVRGRGAARLRVEAALARASVARADVVVTASEAMADLVRPHTKSPIRVIPFGPGLVEGQAPSEDGRLVFLHRTAWGPHKRLVDLLEAVRILAEAYEDEFLVRSACAPLSDPGTLDGPSRPSASAFGDSTAEIKLLRDPLVARHIELKPFRVGEDRRPVGDAVVVPSAVESFCFPLAEAVSLGIPAVAADVPFARELCGAGAFYFEPESAESLAASMSRLLEGERPPAYPADKQDRISWRAHVDGLASVCHEMT